MSNLKQAIFKTVAYYHCLDFPLTSFEIYKYLIKDNLEKTSYGEIFSLLSSDSSLNRFIGEQNGFYFLKNNFGRADGEKIIKQRIDREKISSQKWKRIRMIGKIFQLIPFARMVFVTGSLAQNNSHKNSDLDVLIFAKKDRIWTVRFLTSFLTQILGIRRYGKQIKDRICLNHYIANEFLKIQADGIYNAQIYNRSVLLYEKENNLFSEFQRNNNWIRKYIFNYPFYSVDSEMNLRLIKKRKFLLIFSNTLEFILKGSFGDWFEYKFCRFQKFKMQKNRNNDMFVSDEELKFHPDSHREKSLINATKLVNTLLF